MKKSAGIVCVIIYWNLYVINIFFVIGLNES